MLKYAKMLVIYFSIFLFSSARSKIKMAPCMVDKHRAMLRFTSSFYQRICKSFPHCSVQTHSQTYYTPKPCDPVVCKYGCHISLLYPSSSFSLASLFSSLWCWKHRLAMVNWFEEEIQGRWVWKKCTRQQRYLCDWLCLIIFDKHVEHLWVFSMKNTRDGLRNFWMWGSDGSTILKV